MSKRKIQYEAESDKPENWEEDVLYVKNPDGTVTALKAGESDAPDDKA